MSERMPRTRGRHLNHVALLYDPLVERLSFGREQRFRERTLRWMALAGDERVLDVGCGTGSLTLQVGERLRSGGSVVGVDVAPRMIDIARRKAERAASSAEFRVGLAERLAFADGGFDLVVNSMFTHHLDRQLKLEAFREMHRVLRPGGRLVTADIDRPARWWAFGLGWASRYLLLQPELEDNLRGRLPELMTAAGFVDIRRREQVYAMVSFFTAVKPQA